MAAIFGFTFCTVGDWKISLHIYYIYTGAYGKGGPYSIYIYIYIWSSLAGGPFGETDLIQVYHMPYS